MSSFFQRLTSLDRAFLDIESGPLHMHVGAVAVFDGRGLVAPDGALDAVTLRQHISASLERIPRFRQRVHAVPLLGTAWLDDPDFRIDYHVRHTSVPRPGTRAQLDALAGRLFSQRLDRERPLWEMWLVEGLEDGRFAIVTKAHHAMLDGVEGIGVLGALFSFSPGELGRDGPRDRVRPPHRGALARALFAQRLDELPVLGARLRDLARPEARERVRSALRGAVHMVVDVTAKTPPTPLNPERIGPHRAFGGRRISLESLKSTRRAAGTTLNDVVLAVVAGALRRHLLRRGTPIDGLVLRALVPVNLRTRESDSARQRTGNHVSMLVVPLPVGEADPQARLRFVHEHARALKEGSNEVEAGQLVEEIGDLGPEGLVGLVFALALRMLPFHVIVTNVPGPPVPLYLGPSKLEALYPLVPLFARQSVGVALLSYDGGLFVGINADLDRVPDLEALLDDVAASERELREALGGRRDTDRG
ncbi:MAG: wax ester/triacylglycerol synthase family O-acyltransferase [Sandaracinus sp.]